MREPFLEMATEGPVLTPEQVLPIKLRITLQRQAGEEWRSIDIVRRCHTYTLVENQGVDLFIVDAGRMRRVAEFNGVLCVEEID